MGRYRLIAILALVAVTSMARGAATRFAEEELRRYLGPAADRVDVTIASGKESLSITETDGRIRIVGSDAHMALAGA
jgi:hypothetical protein